MTTKLTFRNLLIAGIVTLTLAMVLTQAVYPQLAVLNTPEGQWQVMGRNLLHLVLWLLAEVAQPIGILFITLAFVVKIVDDRLAVAGRGAGPRSVDGDAAAMADAEPAPSPSERPTNSA